MYPTNTPPIFADIADPNYVCKKHPHFKKYAILDKAFPLSSPTSLRPDHHFAWVSPWRHHDFLQIRVSPPLSKDGWQHRSPACETWYTTSTNDLQKAHPGLEIVEPPKRKYSSSPAPTTEDHTDKVHQACDDPSANEDNTKNKTPHEDGSDDEEII